MGRVARKALGGRSRTAIIPRCRAEKNFSSAIGIRCRFQVGALLSWPARNWKRMQPDRISPSCEIEYANSWTDYGLPCGQRSVAQCADCGLAICEECRMECCGDSYCISCCDYHVTHVCLRKPVQVERRKERSEPA